MFNSYVSLPEDRDNGNWSINGGFEWANHLSMGEW